MATPPKKTSLRLSGGLNTRSQSEFVTPVVANNSEPQLVKSTNTRLGKIVGSVARSPKVTTIANVAGFRRYGLIPSLASKKTQMTTTHGDNGNLDIVDKGISGTVGGVGRSSIGRAYIMATVEGAGEFDALPAVAPVAQLYEERTGLIWRAVLSWVSLDQTLAMGTPTEQGRYSVYVSAAYPDGRQVATMSLINFYDGRAGDMPWVGLTAHPLAGMFVWTSRTGAVSPGIHAQAINIAASGYAVVPTSPLILVINPLDKTVTPDVITQGEYAIVSSGSSASAGDAMITRFHLGPNTVVNQVALPGTVSGKTRTTAQFITFSGTTLLYSAVSREGPPRKTSVARWTDALVSAGAPIEVDYAGTVLIKRGASAMVMIGSAPENFATVVNAGTSAAFDPFLGTLSFTFALPGSTWALTSLTPVFFPYLFPHSHGVEWTDLNGAVHPIVFFVRRYGKHSVLPGEVDYADDPSILAYDLLGFYPTTVARFGVVRGISNPVQSFYNDDFSSRSDLIIGDKIWCGWRKVNNYASTPYSGLGRYTQLSMAPSQLSVTQDKDGSALVACANPATYDGGRMFEMGGVPFSPHIALYGIPSTGGTTAVFRVVAHYEVPDASGVVLRSRPSNVLSFPMTNSPTAMARIFASSVPINLPYAAQVRTVFYGSTPNGTSVHRFRVTAGGVTEGGSFTTDKGSLANLTTTTITESQPQIYSTGTAGEELTPQPPPPLRHISIVNGRCVGIDAEFPTRLVFSKLRVAGIGYEFAPALEVNLPSGSGDGMASHEFNGAWVVLCENGVYQISGDGPNNNGSAGSFSTPIKISDIGCSNTASVVEYPGGIMWQYGNRFASLTAAGILYDQDMTCTHDVVAAVCVPRYDELWFFSATTAETRVFNYGTVPPRWTTWDSQTLPDKVTMARVLPWDQDTVFVYSEESKLIRRIDTDSVSATATNMTFETDWVLLDADFQSHVIIRDVVFSAVVAGPHSLELELLMDYEATPGDGNIRSFPWEHLTANAPNGRYTVRMEPASQNARAVKLRIRDTLVNSSATGGMTPIAATIVYSVDGQLFEEVFNEQTFK